ncbi:MAG: 2-oxoacid:acceptor oxidoreductase subunit alpha [Anaerolineaceae bacterium]|nr:2-oxoacid:acceptor oxidoreductase subunit alpha [Anaerolineaceae bacterium]
MSVQLLQGNNACAAGALAVGCRFFAGYPITPSSEIAETMARELPRLGGKFIQMEDEIASIAAVIGASVGGLKAMTATSGPGFSLMQENIGYAIVAEVPCVIVNVMRAGPSTGLPTSPSQGDVMQARWGTHGDHPIIALAPASVQEAFELTVRAFNLAEKYRIPTLVLMDEVVGHMREKVVLPELRPQDIVNREMPTVPSEWYEPFGNPPSDVPPLAPFGEGYRYHITGLLHDARGFPTNRLDEIQPWVERIFRKIDRNRDDICTWEEDRTEDAPRILVVSYGSTARAAKQAIKVARARYGRKVALFRPMTLWPFPEEALEKAAENVQRIIVAEMNLGQVALEVERIAGRAKVVRVGRADGQMVTPEQILDAMRAPQAQVTPRPAAARLQPQPQAAPAGRAGTDQGTG